MAKYFAYMISCIPHHLVCECMQLSYSYAFTDKGFEYASNTKLNNLYFSFLKHREEKYVKT